MNNKSCRYYPVLAKTSSGTCDPSSHSENLLYDVDGELLGETVLRTTREFILSKPDL